MIYAEYVGNEPIENGVREKAVVASISEFVVLRQSGWSSTEEVNDIADRMIAERLANDLR